MKGNKFVISAAITLFLIGLLALILSSANPALSWGSKIGLIVAAGVAGSALAFSDRFKNVLIQTLLMWIGRFGIWLFFSYFRHLKWDWVFSAMLATALLPWDWWRIYQRNQMELDRLNSQNLPPMNFDLK